jgi:hypothetical protein
MMPERQKLVCCKQRKSVRGPGSCPDPAKNFRKEIENIRENIAKTFHVKHYCPEYGIEKMF